MATWHPLVTAFASASTLPERQRARTKLLCLQSMIRHGDILSEPQWQGWYSLGRLMTLRRRFSGLTQQAFVGAMIADQPLRDGRRRWAIYIDVDAQQAYIQIAH